VGDLVLSLFPGIGLLDMAFEEEDFCIVRGPDLLWGGDIKKFHPPAGKFDGVIGGPPCQAFSALRPLADRARGHPAENLIPEFCRCVEAAKPTWFLMENVVAAPLPNCHGYKIHDFLLRDVWVGGETNRHRRFSFGTRDGHRLHVETLALHSTQPDPAVIASCGGPSTSRKAGGAIRKNRGAKEFPSALRGQGLPSDFLRDAPFTSAGKIKAIGNGVPLPMGRAVAKAVKRAMEGR
jgi:DNA (cytosine-5)-methyltransferase 1